MFNRRVVAAGYRRRMLAVENEPVLLHFPLFQMENMP